MDCDSLTSITIPNSVLKIGPYAFDGCDNLVDVNYLGSINEWNVTSVGKNNECLTYATIDCTDGTINEK